MNHGVPVSPGVAVARAYCVDHALTRREPQYLDEAGAANEVGRFDQATAAAGRELDAVVERVARQIGEDEAAIFRSHRMLLRDPTFHAKVKAAIAEHRLDAATALLNVLEEFEGLFRRVPDSYLRDRVADLRDVGERVLTHLAAHENQVCKIAPEEPVILVVPEILPSEALCLDGGRVAGLLTERGGATGHAAILARSLGIPAVSGVPDLMKRVRTGDVVALDGREGHVHINPGPEVEAAYRKLRREYVALRDTLVANRDRPAVSADGVPVELFANVNGPADAAAAARAGAAGVGLYRTEYLFLAHPSVPTEEEQLDAYRQVIEAAPRRTVTIRTLDLGGDKQVPYLGQRQEANPFMGFRSTRLSAAYPELFAAQLRAILRAAVHGRVSVLFPMISSLEEVRQVRQAVEAAKAGLRRAGVAHADDVPVGVMIEVPAAALCVREMLDEVDFVSIGSNDLVQYLMAADRDNPRVAHLCEPFGPALLRLLSQVIRACDERGKPVTLCGEMAGRPRCVLALLGMGLRRLSMSSGFVPQIKDLLGRTRIDHAIAVARDVLAMGTVAEVRGHLTGHIREIWPNVQLLDLQQ